MFNWFVNLFRSKRWKQIHALLPYAKSAAEAISGKDIDGDGHVDARAEFVTIVGVLPAPIRRAVFGDYLTSDGTINTAAVAAVVPRVLKKTLAMAMLVRQLVGANTAVPAYGILDTALQLAYEAIQK